MKISSEPAYQDVVKFRETMKRRQLTGTQLYELLKHRTPDERNAVASRAGAKLRKSAEGKKGILVLLGRGNRKDY